MSMKEEELLGRLERIVKPAMCHLKYWTKKDEQAYQQIREMIQKKPGELPQKRALTVDEIISKYPESVRILLGELLLKIENLQKPEIIIRPRFSKRTEVTEEFIGNKGRELFGWSADPKTIKECEDFIRSLVEEMPWKKATVTEEFVKKWAKKLEADSSPYNVDMGIDKEKLKQMLKDAGVEVVGNKEE